MIKEALEYIVGLNKPELMEISGQTYSDKHLNRISHNPKAESICMGTLTSLVEYIKADIDDMSPKMIVQVVDPLQVRLISMMDNDRMREELISVKGSVPDFSYGKYMGNEEFLISLQAKFLQNDDRDLLLRFAGTAEKGSVAKYSDDGVSQKATVKKGIAGREDTVVPNPVKLRPFRTFIEVEQPESQFVFRMRDGEYEGIQCAVFEADGGAWKNVAMKYIKEYLEFELAKFKQFTVIS